MKILLVITIGFVLGSYVAQQVANSVVLKHAEMLIDYTARTK